MNNIKTVEEKLGFQLDSSTEDIARVNLKINKNGSLEDAYAYAMLQVLKEKNINISKHIRMLLALEVQGLIYVDEQKAIIPRTILQGEIPYQQMVQPVFINPNIPSNMHYYNNVGAASETLNDNTINQNDIEDDKTDDVPPPPDDVF